MLTIFQTKYNQRQEAIVFNQRQFILQTQNHNIKYLAKPLKKTWVSWLVQFRDFKVECNGMAFERFPLKSFKTVTRFTAAVHKLFLVWLVRIESKIEPMNKKWKKHTNIYVKIELKFLYKDRKRERKKLTQIKLYAFCAIYLRFLKQTKNARQRGIHHVICKRVASF